MFNIFGNIMCAWGKHKYRAEWYSQYETYIQACERCHEPFIAMYEMAETDEKYRKALAFHIIQYELLDPSFDWQGCYDKETDPHIKKAITEHIEKYDLLK